MEVIKRVVKQLPVTFYTIEVSEEFLQDLLQVIQMDCTIPDVLNKAGEHEAVRAFSRLAAYHDKLCQMVGNG